MANVLLVADAEWVRNDIEAAISDPTTSVTVLDDPARAATVAARTRFDLIVVDMQVKSMGGMAIIRLLRDAMATQEMEPVPIILLLDRAVDSFLAKRAGASAHLIKPISAQAFRSTVDALTPV
ncbi:MAG TPA: response regulator [Acidimicrobiia bacterium]